MSMRFVIGRAGAGKTRFLHERLVTHIQPDPLTSSAILLVPKQATFTAQRAIATDPRLLGYVNVRVIAPDDLGELALVETGQPDGARLDVVGRSLILSHLLRTHAGELEHFASSAGRPGLATEIDRTFGEFERAGRNLCEVDDLIESAMSSDDTAQQALARKLRDLCRLYKLYQQFLADHGFDPYKRQTQAPDAIECCLSIQKSLVLIDDFYEFTAYERSLITSLARSAKDTLIALTFDPASPILRDPHLFPDDLDVFHRTQTTYRQLYFALSEGGVTIDPPVLLREPARFASRALERIERGFDTRNLAPAANDGAVTLHVATDPADEVDTAARQIKALLASGLRMRDVCVLARAIEDYEPLIDAAFAEHGLSFFVDRRRQATNHPLARSLSAVAMVVLSRWSHESVLELARGGIIAISAADADLLADYLRQHNIPSREWLTDEPWQFDRIAEEDAGGRAVFTPDEVERVNTVRSLIRRVLGPLGHPEWTTTELPVRQRVLDLFALMERMNARAAVVAMIERAEVLHDIQARDEHEQVWSRITEVADQLVDLLGDLPVTGTQFATLLQSTLAELELAIIPPTLDQVLVGSIERTRPRNPRAVVLLGMNAGQFPRAVGERSVLNDRDRHSLHQAHVEVEPPSRQAMLDERFLGYLALTRGTERLTLLRVGCDPSGNEYEPSPFWRHVEASVAELSPTPTHGPVDKIATPRQVVSHVLSWIRRQRDGIARDDSAALYDWLANDPSPPVKAVRDRAWPVLKYRNAPVLSKTVSLRLFKSPLESSVSRFESFAACPFQHFARYGLRLQPPPERDITALDLGSLYHSVLERLVRRVIDEHVDFTKTPTLTPEQIREIAAKVAEQLRNQVFLSSARNRYTLDRLETVVHRLIRSQQFVAEHGDFRPAFTELEFGRGAKLPALELDTPGGNKVLLRGKVDRVDLDQTGQLFSVIDYKLGGEQLALGYVAHGLMLQLLTYLLVIEANGESLAGKKLTPAAALYVRMLRSIDSTKDPESAPLPDEPEFLAKTKPRGVISANYAGRLDHKAASGESSDVLAIKFRKDGSLSDGGNDAVDHDQFLRLVGFVRTAITELADRIIAGEIAVSPYLIVNETPCSTCPFPSVCRFDRLINNWRPLPRLSRKDALDQINGAVEAATGGDDAR